MSLANKLADYQQFNLDEINDLHLELLDVIRSLDSSNNLSTNKLINIATRIGDINELITKTCNEMTELLKELDNCNVTRSEKADKRRMEYEDFQSMLKVFGPYITLFNIILQQNRLN